MKSESLRARKNGFTLVELLFVIAIIALISMLTAVLIDKAREKARDTVRRDDLSQVNKAMQMYYSNNTKYPTAGTCGDAGIIADDTADKLLCGGSSLKDANTEYFAQIPQDPVNSSDQRYILADVSDETYCIHVKLEQGGWFVCQNSACNDSGTDCDGNT